jgi:D-tyrosyl-tRNA(Tyr) deacylase
VGPITPGSGSARSGGSRDVSSPVRHEFDYVLVISEADPVARAVAAQLGTTIASEHRVDGVALRSAREGVGVLHRSGLHIRDDLLYVPGRSPEDPAPTLVFPSVHRSESSTPALTVHPLGNPGPSADVGGRPETLVLTDPLLMTDALRRTSEVGAKLGWRVSFEATHHGPWLRQPAFFVEIGAVPHDAPPADAVREFASFLVELHRDDRDSVAVGVGGGHYAPRFTELALKRRWAFGHLLPRHALAHLSSDGLAEAFRATPGAKGILYQRSADAAELAGAGGFPKLRETEAPLRESPT